MKPRFALALLALLGIACSHHDPEQPERQVGEDHTMDHDMLDGEWEVVACQIGGVANDANIGARIQIHDGVIRDHPAATGIYELTANELTFCWTTPDRPLPQTLSVSGDPDCHMYVYNRVERD